MLIISDKIKKPLKNTSDDASGFFRRLRTKEMKSPGRYMQKNLFSEWYILTWKFIGQELTSCNWSIWFWCSENSRSDIPVKVRARSASPTSLSCYKIWTASFESTICFRDWNYRQWIIKQYLFLVGKIWESPKLAKNVYESRLKTFDGSVQFRWRSAKLSFPEIEWTDLVAFFCCYLWKDLTIKTRKNLLILSVGWWEKRGQNDAMVNRIIKRLQYF